MVEMDVQYEGDLHCSARHGPSGAGLATDAPVDNKGRGEAFSPTDLLAAALGTCMLTIMGIHARREAMELQGARVHLTKEMVADPARRIGRLTATVFLPAHLEPPQRAALEEMARSNPVQRSLHPDVKVELAFRYGS